MPRAAPLLLERPEGRFELRRFPSRREESLQAWCGADLLLLDAARDSGLPAGDTLVVNDEHGVLATVLRPRASWTDSALSAMALSRNLERNTLPPVPVHWSIRMPGDGFRLVLLRVPKQLPYFEYQLACLQQCMVPGALLVCGGMDKHLSPHTAALVEKYFGTVTRHRGSRKARLFSASRDDRPPANVPPRPRYHCELLDADLFTGANVFSRDGVDIGSRFLLEQLPRLTPVARGADLACGNGVLGLAALASGLCREMTFAEESAMAIAAARDNCAALFGERSGLHFLHGDGLSQAGGVFDLILCNPPFHFGHSVDDFAGRRLLLQCAGRLAPSGALCVVANRHLPYRSLLQRHFPRVEVLAANSKFSVWIARAGC